MITWSNIETLQIPERFREARKKLGTMAEVAALIGCDHSMIGHWESGLRKIKRKDALAMAALIEIAPSPAEAPRPDRPEPASRA
jgi:transcriptional regulator with XRE-family HTH domain